VATPWGYAPETRAPLSSSCATFSWSHAWISPFDSRYRDDPFGNRRARRCFRVGKNVLRSTGVRRAPGAASLEKFTRVVALAGDARDFILRTRNGARLRPTSERCVRARFTLTNASMREVARSLLAGRSPDCPRCRAESDTPRLALRRDESLFGEAMLHVERAISLGARAATPQTPRVFIHPSELGCSRRLLRGLLLRTAHARCGAFATPSHLRTALSSRLHLVRRAATPQTSRIDREFFGPAPLEARKNSLTHA
jgi:hypothetical protein